MAKHPSENHDLSIAYKSEIIESVNVKAKQLRTTEIDQSEIAATKVSISLYQ